MDNVNLPLGLRVQTQIPLDVKTYSPNEATLSNLGVSDNLAFTYVQGLIVYCIEEKTRWEWREAVGPEIGLRPTNFTYPNNTVAFGIDYSNKEFNFFSVSEVIVETSPFENKDEGNGIGIVVRGRDQSNYGSVGFRAFDVSFSDSASPSKGATGTNSYAEGLNTTASAARSHAEGWNTVAGAFASHAEGFGSITAGGNACHAEGTNTKAEGNGAHAEGSNTFAVADASHAEGGDTLADGQYSHAEGKDCHAEGTGAHAEGKSTYAKGRYSNASGNSTQASSLAEMAIGSFGNIVEGDSTTFVSTDRLFHIGNGPDVNNRSDALVMLKSGLTTLPATTNAMITAASGKAIVTKEFLQASIPIIQNTLQKVITNDYTLTDDDNNYVIIINNVTPITITLNTTITVPRFNVGFIQKGTTANTVTFASTGVTLNTPVGYKLRGQFYQAFIERELNTIDFYLLGNTKL